MTAAGALAGVEARTACKIAVRGQFVANDHKLPEGERKLHLEISGASKAAVKQARQELHQMVEETAIQTLNIPSRK